MSDNILRNIRPVDNRAEQEKIDNQFIPIGQDKSLKMTII